LPLLEVDSLEKYYSRRGATAVCAADRVSFTLDAGESLGLIGESGSGKSSIARMVLGLTAPDAGVITFDGQELSGLARNELRLLRAKFQLVFQEPLESLNPAMRVGQTVEEPLIVHRPDISRAQRLARVGEVFEEVGLRPALMDRYPRELSGGQQQRVAIARAIITTPRLVVLDEPTASLDVSVRAVILELLRDLKKRHGLAYLFISHDIGTVDYFCDRVAVMYRGRIVEIGDSDRVLRASQHPYTKALVSAMLTIDPDDALEPVPLLETATSLDSEDFSSRCVLCGRCPEEVAACSRERPPLRAATNGCLVACVHAQPAREGEARDAPGESSPMSLRRK
jgi:oligopeptide/dipeptide ABC transporter ATP-binding protein